MPAATARRHPFALSRAAFLALWLAGPIGAQTLFTEVTEEAGLQAFPATVRGATFVDQDNDGFPDVFLVGDGWYPLPHRPRPIGLFRNTGDGRFEDQTVVLPPAVNHVIGGGDAAFGDYDNDGDQDLFLAVQPQNALLRNDRGRFGIADPGSDLTDSMATDAAIWLDYDRDGYLDLYVGNLGQALGWSRGFNRLLRNRGDGSFVDRTEEAGLETALHPQWGGSFGGMVGADLSTDGWPDLYLGVFRAPNRLFLSDGQGGFQDATSTEVADPGEAYGVAVGDLDNDGDLEIYQAAGGYGGKLWHSPLLANLGGGHFLDVTESSGLAVLGASNESPSLADIDNDGDLDLILGLTFKGERPERAVLLNDGVGVFVDRTASSGLEGWGSPVVVGDYDGDGFVDLLMDDSIRRHVTLYRNNGNENHWLRVELVGVQSNRDGIGARVLATSGDLVQMREILGGRDHCQDERVAHFGLGSRRQVDRLEIRWPSGQESVLYDVPADQRIRVFEGREGYHLVKPTVWMATPAEVVIAGATSRIAAVVKPTLFEAEARITSVTADLSELGGPAELPLEPGDGGTYRFSTTLPVDVPRGPHTVWVNVEQRTFLGDYWVRLSQQVMVAPRADLEVFGRTGEGGWTWYGEDLTRVTHDALRDVVAAWSPDGTQLAFFSYRDGNGEIYICSADGSDPINLTRDAGFDGWPSWSPDGSKIAFYTDRDGNYEVYVMDADGSDPVNLSRDPGYDGYPSWSPDGTKIAFHTNRDGNQELYVMDAQGGNPTNLTNHDATDAVPSWSPDGRRIAFLSLRGGPQEVYVLDLETGTATKLAERFAVPSTPWSPGGREIVFESARRGNLDIYRMQVDGGDPLQLSHHPRVDMNAAWSPSGSQLVFASDRTGNLDLFVLTMGESSRVTIDPQERGTVYAGSEALAVHAAADWWLSCQPSESFDWAGYDALHFAFHPGDLDASAGGELSAWIDGKGVDLLGEGWVDLSVADWQEVDIPLKRFALNGPIAALDFSGDVTGTFYVDDVRLKPVRPTPGMTAVEEERAGSLPTQPALAQNYPNPFNAGTVIDFSLPTPGEVRLSVYNLAGQEVTTLVQGRSVAGTHRVQWDGRGDDGRQLASGIYLYRLSAKDGGQALTRKLALIR